MKIVQVLAAYFCIVTASFANLASHGVFFDELEFHNQDVTSETTLASLFETPFQTCYSNDYCNFVVKDTRTGKFSTKEKESDLPAEKQFRRIWKKVKPGILFKGFFIHFT